MRTFIDFLNESKQTVEIDYSLNKNVKPNKLSLGTWFFYLDKDEKNRKKFHVENLDFYRSTGTFAISLMMAKRWANESNVKILYVKNSE